MEINAGEAARAVLDYVLRLQEHSLVRIQDSEADFEQHAQVFERLAGTGRTTPSLQCQRKD